MKVQCERCRETFPLTDFVSTSQGVRIRCPACHEECFVPSPGGERPVDGMPAAALFSCPKCGRPQERADACRFCGLIFDRWEPGRSELDEADDEAQERWAATEAAWDDAERHDRFIDWCASTGQLAFAARCYRQRLTKAPDDAMGLAKQAKIVSVAEATLLTQKPEDRPVPQRRTLLWGVVVVFAGLVAYFTSPLWRWW